MTNASPPDTPGQTQGPSQVEALDPEGDLPLGASEYFFYLLFQVARQRDLFCDKALNACGLTMAQWRSLAIVRRRPWAWTCFLIWAFLARRLSMARTWRDAMGFPWRVQKSGGS